MINHILVPLDGSALAECVIPHTLSVCAALNARVTLLQVLERPRDTGALQPIDPLKWSLKKHEADRYLDLVMSRFTAAGLKVERAIQEGSPAECIVNFANNNAADLIALSTHGFSGLSGWNVSSVVQKIISRSHKSTLLIRAYDSRGTKSDKIHYQRLFVGLDCSARAELVMPVAMRLAQFYKASFTVGTVVPKPEIISRFPLSSEDAEMIDRIAERNQKAASHYLQQIQSQYAQAGIDLKTNLAVSENPTAALHKMVEEEQSDMVILAAHGHTGDARWPYGNVTASFIANGNTSLFIMQDLPGEDIQRTKAEIAMLETQGH